jgi:hypothetical protein
MMTWARELAKSLKREDLILFLLAATHEDISNMDPPEWDEQLSTAYYGSRGIVDLPMRRLRAEFAERIVGLVDDEDDSGLLEQALEIVTEHILLGTELLTELENQ